MVHGGPVFVPYAAFPYGVRVKFAVAGCVNTVVNGPVHDLTDCQLAVRVQCLFPPFHWGKEAHIQRRVVPGAPMEQEFGTAGVVDELRSLGSQGQEGGLFGLFPGFLQGGGFFVHGVRPWGQGRGC